MIFVEPLLIACGGREYDTILADFVTNSEFLFETSVFGRLFLESNLENCHKMDLEADERQWTPIQDMPLEKAFFPLLSRGDGFLYSFGGVHNWTSGVATKDVDRYSIADDNWDPQVRSLVLKCIPPDLAI